MNKISDLQKYKVMYAYLKIRGLFARSKNEIHREIVNIDGKLLEFIKDEDKTFEICLDAVLNCNEAIKYIPRSLSLKEKCVLHKALKKDEEEILESPVKLVNPAFNRV